jgi:glyoxylase-like metal-dependent hydrolase (beta-lactamase superfamily II)
MASMATAIACGGPPGEPGADGEDGAAGAPGADGSDGRDGADRVLDPALAPIDKMFAALGGRDAVLAVDGIEVDATGVRFIAGEGPDPAAEPAVANEYSTTTSIDLGQDFARVDTAREVRFLFAGNEQTFAEIAQGDRGAVDGVESAFGFPTGAMSPDRAAAFRKQLRLLHPLLLARAIAEDETIARDGGDAVLGRLLFHVLVVDDAVAPIEIYVDAQTGEIARVATVENDYMHRDVAFETLYLRWEPAGTVRAPREVYLVKDGEILVAEDREVASIDPQFAGTLFDFPAGANPVTNAELALRGERSHQFHYTFQAFGLPFDGIEGPFTANALTPSVVHLVGQSHHSLVVAQQNGLIVIDAPLYDERAEAILTELGTRFPGKAITHVVASHFHEDHVSGIRTLLGATNASLVVSAHTADFWRGILSARSTIVPDALAENPRNVEIVTVPPSGTLTLPDATNPVTLNNLTNFHAADLLMAYTPAADVAFIVDIYSPGNGAFPFVTAQFRDALVAADFDSPTLRIAGGHGFGTATFAQLESDIAALP